MKKTLLAFLMLVLYGNLKSQTQPNIIFIVFDDLNDYVEGYGGQPQTLTPNLSEVMNNGVAFTNAITVSTVCAPSRTSFLTGKAPKYTGIYNNEEFSLPFRDLFSPDQLIITLPEWLKDSAGYFTYDIDKIFHCGSCELDAAIDEHPDYDTDTPDPCNKSLSWSKQKFSDEEIDHDVNEGINHLKWAAIDSGYVTGMGDYNTATKAVSFLDNYSANPFAYCGRPFFLAVGIRKPHSNLYIPEQYFMDDYVDDFYAEPYDIPYNDPPNANPVNGVVMPPQPDPVWDDYYSLPSLGKRMVGSPEHYEFISWPTDSLDPLPVIDAGLTDAERIEILSESKRANAVMAYLAAIKFADEQVGRILDALEAHPELYNNTIIIITSDHGYSLGEKTAWGKGKLWETNIRVPLIVADLRNIQPGVCNRAVSLLDLFPTVCDYAGVAYPHFDDGENYLDGYSLIPLINNPLQIWERPATTQIEPQELECFPQNSIRTQRWHYIYYKSDNAVGLDGCNEALSYNQGELYDIGETRQTDPEEWNNLAEDPDYAPVVEYLQQFLPDSLLYLKKVNSISISNVGSVPCLLSATSNLKLKAQIYSPDGVLMTAAELAGFTIEWKNNLTAAVSTGTTLNFSMATIPADVFASHDRIMFYVHVYDPSGNLIAFNTKNIYINLTTAPSFSFTTSVTGATVSITSFTILGEYQNTSWDFGDGYLTEDYLPAPHTYATSGNYTIKSIVTYGNGCTKVKQKKVHIVVPKTGATNTELNVYPVPANNKIIISGFPQSENNFVEVVDITGKVVMKYSADESRSEIILDISSISPGMYIVRLQNNAGIYSRLIEVMR